MGILVPIVFLIGSAYVVVTVTRTIADTVTRLKILKTGASPELAASLVSPPERNPAMEAALQLGLTTGGVGLALIIIQFIPFEAEEPISIGIVLLFAAAGLMAYHAAAGRLNRRRA